MIDEKVVGEHLTAAQAHLLVGVSVNTVALPGEATMPPDQLNASNDE
jgi:hypothetical protein